MLVLGLESSCDETAAAVVRRGPDGSGEILSNIVYGQDGAHAAYGGVVPEIAARAHVEKMDVAVAAAMERAGLAYSDLRGVAATAGPGLIGGVLVGLVTGQAVAIAHGLPFLGVNHLEGHALTVRLTEGVDFPYVLLLVSGGHTQLLEVVGLGRYRRLGTTIDDAAGEAFDKTAKLLGLPHPGGPNLERAAREGDPGRFALPKPLSDVDGCDFSFSGLKTAARRALERLEGGVTDQDRADLAASFQKTVAEILGDRTARALSLVAANWPSGAAKTVVVAGGVAANGAVRQALAKAADAQGFTLVAPPPALCSDNAAMIAWAGAERFAAGERDDLGLAPRPRWPLDPDNASIGGGKKGAKA